MRSSSPEHALPAALRASPTGQGVANPVGAILSAAMMLDELRMPEIAERVRFAVATACAAGTCTRDVGGRATSGEVTDAIITSLRKTSS